MRVRGSGAILLFVNFLLVKALLGDRCFHKFWLDLLSARSHPVLTALIGFLKALWCNINSENLLLFK